MGLEERLSYERSAIGGLLMGFGLWSSPFKPTIYIYLWRLIVRRRSPVECAV